MTEPPEAGAIKEIVGYVLSGIFAFALGVMTLVGRYSKMALNRARDSDDVTSISEKNRRIAKLESDLDIVYAERNAALSQVGGLTATVTYLGEQIEELRAENRVRAKEVLAALNKRSEIADFAGKELSKALHENTDLTKKAVDQAAAAFKAANTVNEKIEAVGLVAKDGRDFVQRDGSESG